VQDLCCVFANNRMASNLGVPGEDVVGRPVMEFVWPEDRGMIATRHQNRLAGEEAPNGYDFRIINAQGNPVWVCLSSAKIMPPARLPGPRARPWQRHMSPRIPVVLHCTLSRQSGEPQTPVRLKLQSQKSGTGNTGGCSHWEMDQIRISNFFF